MSWGSNTSNESKPNWRHLETAVEGEEPLKNRVIATEKGWAIQRPWGNEVIVAIGGLNTNLGAPTIAELFLLSDAEIANAVAQVAEVLVQFNEPVLVTGTPTLVLLGSGGASNVTLSYDSAGSDLDAGRVVFANSDFGAGAMTVGGLLTANASSVLTGWAGIVDATSNVAVANAVVGTLSIEVIAAV